MSVTVSIPTPLRGFTGGRDAVEWRGPPWARCSTSCWPRTRGSSDTSCRTTAVSGPSSTCISTTRTSASWRRPRRRSPRATCSRSCPASRAAARPPRPPCPSCRTRKCCGTRATCCCPRSASRGSESSRRRGCSTIGAGGLGSPLSLYLAAAGVGHHRHRRLRRGRPHQPPATDRPRHLYARPPEAGVGQGAAHRPQPQRERGRGTRRGSPPRTRWRSSGTTTSSSTAPTTSRPATS